MHITRTILCILALLPALAMADGAKCGKKVYWNYDTNAKILSIKGEGEMYDYEYSDVIPWNSYVDKIETIFIYEDVTTIGDNAFAECSALTSVIIPESVTSIGEEAFSNCSSLTTINIPTSVTVLKPRAFAFCINLNNVTIPASITAISDYAFYHCEAMTSMRLPATVTSIGESAFADCYSMTLVTIPASVKSISEDAFEDSGALLSIISEIENPFAIDESAFEDNYETATLYVPIGKKTLYQAAEGWKNFKNIVETEPVPPTNGQCGEKVFWKYDTNTETLTIEGNGAMYDFATSDKMPWAAYKDKITTVVVREKVTTIGNGAFYGFGKITSVTLPYSLTGIGQMAFLSCTSLTSIDLPIELETIGRQAFTNCTGLSKIVIPESVTNIGQMAFSNCKNITSVTSLSESPSPISTVFDSEVYSNATLNIPLGTLSTYKATDGWRNFININEETTSVSNVQQSADLKTVEIYQANGMKSPTLQRGLNIIKMSDGTVRKVAR